MIQMCLLVLAEEGRKAADLSTQGRAHVLRRVRHKVFHTGHNLVEQRLPVNETAESYFGISWSPY